VAIGSTSGIFIYDSSSKELIRFIDATFNIAEMTFSPDGAHILAGSFDGKVKVWNAHDGQFVRELVHEKHRATAAAPVSVITYSANGRGIAVGYQDGSINYFSQDQELPATVLDQYLTVEDIAFSGDNRFMYVSNGTNLITVLDIATWKEIGKLSNPAPIHTMRLSRDRQFLLSGGGKNSVYIWDLIEERLVSSFSNLGGLVTDFDFSYDDTLIAIGLNNGQVKVFEKPQPEDYSKAFVPISALAGSGDPIRSVAFSPSQPVLASGSWNDGLKVWEARTGSQVFVIEKDMPGINSMHFSPDGNWLATAHEGNTVRVWQVDTAHEVYRFEGYLPKGIPFSPDNVFLTVVQIPQKNQMAVLQLIELTSGKVITSQSGFQPNWFVQFTSDSKLFVMGDSHAASIWDVTTWEQVNAHGGMNAGCGQYFTPQNDRLTIISDAGILFSFDQTIQDLCATKPQGLTLMYYFQKERRALFVLGDGRVWDWDFGPYNFARIRSSMPYPLPGDIFLAGDQVSGFYAYASNNSLITANISSGARGITINSQDDYQYRVTFSPNRKLMALGSKYGSIHLWAMP
jgi:WD40 repeat protein